MAGMVALTLFVGLIGCSEKPAQGDNGSQISFTYWGELNPAVAALVQTYNDVGMYKALEKKTGITIEFIHPPTGQQAEQFNLMIASRDLPDMIEYNWINYMGGPGKAINDNIIISLNQFMEGQTPNFTKLVTGGGEFSDVYAKGTKTDKNDFFAFPAFNVGKYRTFVGIMLRQDWLSDLNLSVPETIDEWTTVLRAFKQKKNAKAPLTGSVQFVTGDNRSGFNGAFNVGRGLYVEDGIIKYGPMEEGYRAFIQLLRDWYAEGLLDNDYPTNSDVVMNAKMTDGTSGARIGGIGGVMGTYLKMMETVNPSYDLVGAPYPVLNKGETDRFLNIENDVQHPYLAITTACGSPEIAARWADNLYSEDGFMLLNFGVENESYTMVDGHPVYTENIISNSRHSISEALGLYTRATTPAPGLNQAEDYLKQYYKYSQQVDAFELWAQNVDEARRVVIPTGVIPTLEESEEIAALRTDIDTYVSEMVLKFIQGVEPMENYDGFINRLVGSFNVERYLELQQAAYNRYLKR